MHHHHRYQDQQQTLEEQHSHHHHQHQHRSHHHQSGTNAMTDGMFLQDAWMSLAQNLQMQSITSFQHLSTQYIDQVVDIEMKRLRANCKREEDRYVEQMLLENPIVVERRTQSPLPSSLSVQSTRIAATDATPKTNDNNYPKHSTGNGSSTSTSINNRSSTRGMTKAQNQEHKQQQQQPQQELLQQRAESCRRSRINNKIKKAKMKFRHKFMSSKLMQSVGMLECIQKLIDQTEMQLVSQGFPVQQLEKLKELFCNVRL